MLFYVLKFIGINKIISFPLIQLVLDGKINKKGVHIPITPDIYNPILSEVSGSTIT